MVYLQVVSFSRWCKLRGHDSSCLCSLNASIHSYSDPTHESSLPPFLAFRWLFLIPLRARRTKELLRNSNDNDNDKARDYRRHRTKV